MCSSDLKPTGTDGDYNPWLCETRATSPVSWITGIGLTAFGRHPGRQTLDLMSEAAQAALLDARLLADVYLAMSGGQNSLALGDVARPSGARAVKDEPAARVRRTGALRVVSPDHEEVDAHLRLQELLDRESKAPCLWRRLS